MSEFKVIRIQCNVQLFWCRLLVFHSDTSKLRTTKDFESTGNQIIPLGLINSSISNSFPSLNNFIIKIKYMAHMTIYLMCLPCHHKKHTFFSQHNSMQMKCTVTHFTYFNNPSYILGMKFKTLTSLFYIKMPIYIQQYSISHVKYIYVYIERNGLFTFI